MKKTTFTLLISLFACQTFAQSKRFNIVFESDQITIAGHQKNAINEIGTHLILGDRVLFYPLDYDSTRNLYTYSRNAKKQATEIAAYAATIGFDLIGMPSNFPSGYSGLSVGVSMIYSRPTEPPIVEEKIDPGSASIKDHFPEKPSQYFIINPKRDTLIIGNEGTKLLFNAGCLLTAENVKIELKEYYVLADYLKSGLSTVSNGKMIQTGGSMYLNATENNAGKKQVKINPNQGVAVDFTIGKSDPSMQIFVKDPKSVKSINWILPSIRQVREVWEMTETIIGPDGNIISEKKFKSKEEWELHVKEEEKKEKERKEAAELKEKEQLKAAAIKQETQNKMESKLKIYQLGYINCDKFSNEPVVSFTIAADEKLSAEYYLVYLDIRSVMPIEVNDKKLNFYNVAKNRSAKLIGVSFINKQAYYFECTIAEGGKPSSKVALQPVEENFLNQQLALLK